MDGRETGQTRAWNTLSKLAILLSPGLLAVQRIDDTIDQIGLEQAFGGELPAQRMQALLCCRNLVLKPQKRCPRLGDAHRSKAASTTCAAALAGECIVVLSSVVVVAVASVVAVPKWNRSNKSPIAGIFVGT